MEPGEQPADKRPPKRQPRIESARSREFANFASVLLLAFGVMFIMFGRLYAGVSGIVLSILFRLLVIWLGTRDKNVR